MIPRRLFSSLLICIIPVLTHANADDSVYARLLDRYVEPNGVRYAAWAENAEDRAALANYLDSAAGVDPARLDRPARIAFFINLYNAAMLQAGIENWPIPSVVEIGPEPFSIFKKRFIHLGDEKLSLDMIEKEILLTQYFDPRIHFAVNCASESCPPLRSEPFDGERLDQQLDEQTRLFANSNRAARVSKSGREIAFSSLFDWYANDFPGDNPAEYLNRYREVALPTDAKTLWIEYDWSLNVAPGS